MGILFTAQQSAANVTTTLENALRVDPASIGDPSSEAEIRAEALQTQTERKLSLGRLAIAIVLLLGLLFATIFAARDAALVEDLYPLLLHSFELILGAVIGLLTGEAISR